ncbi:MAG: hypothetical protein AAGE96_14450 [Cyanobacteria bacterium P01_G01_bin.19]
MRPRQLNIKRLKDLKAEFTKLTGREANAKSARSYLKEKEIDLGKLDFRKKVTWEKIILEINFQIDIDIEVESYKAIFERLDNIALRRPLYEYASIKVNGENIINEELVDAIDSCPRDQLIDKAFEKYKEDLTFYVSHGGCHDDIVERIYRDFDEPINNYVGDQYTFNYHGIELKQEELLSLDTFDIEDEIPIECLTF